MPEEVYPLTREGVAAALAALGSTPDEVAETLHAGGHLGIPVECRDCPVARYLQAVFPGVEVRVYDVFVAVFPAEGDRFEVFLPPPVADLVELFDAGRVPQLREHPFAESGATS